MGGIRRLQFSAEIGRVTTKTNDRRDIQLSLRFVF